MKALLFLLAIVLGATAAPARAQEPPKRPKVGLVLSGGGARGLAHVGVLKVLEREGVPVDVIAGTSMGAIIGGLYASGMTAEQLEAELLKVDWDALFSNRVARPQLSQRRKEEDFEIAPAIEIGLRDGEFRAPLGALSGRGLELLLRRYTLPVHGTRDFDRLPIPFRAVATDMESGAAVLLRDGDLALALRSSMSVPGVFAPTEVGGHILGDGGLVDNVPIGVARAMGADVLIVVNIGTPLSGRAALESVGGLTGQMINILTEQNVQRSLATLTPADVLVQPDLGQLTSGDFARANELIALGERGADPFAVRLRSLALDRDRYAQWRAALPRAAPPDGRRIAFVAFEGTELTNPKRFQAQLESQPGQPFDTARAERDVRRLAASGDYLRADYALVSTPDGDGLVFDLEDKPWGPNYLRIGLDLSTDFRGDSGFNIKISHNRHWLDANGTEWRNRIQIGAVPRWFTEWYHPLNWTLGLSNDWFVAAYGDLQRRDLVVYDNDSGTELGRVDRKSARVGLDLGQPWGTFGELRVGLVHTVLRSRLEIVAGAQAPRGAFEEHETGLRLGAVVDQLDYANFPQRGWRVVGEAVAARRAYIGLKDDRLVHRFEGSANVVGSIGRHTLNATLLVQTTDPLPAGRRGPYTLGGFHQLSGYQINRFDGSSLLFGRLVYYQRRLEVPLLTRGLFLGGSLEAGNVWASRRAATLGDLRTGGSLFVGVDTGLGPLYLGLTYAPRGEPGVVLFIGRP